MFKPKCILLFEHAGHRVVYNKYGREVILEYADVDSLGAQCWKQLRVIPYLFEAPGGVKRPNLLHEFLLKIFEADCPMPQALEDKFQEQQKRRLET